MRALFIADSAHHRILAVSLKGKIIETVGNGKAGARDGAFTDAEFNAPQGMAYRDGMLYVADTNNHLLRAVDFAKRRVLTLAGTGKQGYERNAHNAPARSTPLSSPWDVAFYPDDHHLAIAMAGTHQLWSYDIAKQTLSAIAGNGRESIEDGALPDNSLSQPSGLMAAENTLYFVDAETSSLRKFEGGKVTTLIGTGLFDFGLKDGTRAQALMQHCIGVGGDENAIYVADSYNHAIREFDPKSGTLKTLTGNGERGFKGGNYAEARFSEPSDIKKAGDRLYVADTNNSAIRIVDLAERKVSTLAISPPEPEVAAQFSGTLPNLLPLMDPSFDQLAPDKPVTVTLHLKPDWHINPDAPSAFALFAMKDSPMLVKAFDREEVKAQHLTLPPLAKGMTYYLQGTFYYCEKKAGAQCLIGSVNIPLKTEGNLTAVSLPIN
jgi:DNA-binding beta-propeller fold protein YncE